MNATFTTAIRYFVATRCESPLRTGGSVRDPKAILMDAYQEPFVQGTSLAGAFRNWREDPSLFPNTDLRSPLMFSDLRLTASLDQDQTVQTVIRPRVRIDGKRGTSKGTGKFDMAALPTGTTGHFELVLTGHEDPLQIAERIEQYLSALNNGEITLGAQKPNGFGRVSITVKRRIYRMTVPADLEAWLKGSNVEDAQPIELSSRMEQSVLFTVTAQVPGILVKAPGSNAGGGPQNPYGKKGKTTTIFTQIEECGQKLIPGSSLKGTIRGQMTRICAPLKYETAALENLFGHENRRSTGGAAGVVRFSDGHLTQERTVKVPRIRINRLTGGIINQGFFSDEAVDANLSFEIRIPAAHKAGCAMLLYALRDLGLGLYELGSGTAVGRGRLKNTRIQICHADAQAELCCAETGITLTDPDGLVAGWEAELRRRAPL